MITTFAVIGAFVVGYVIGTVTASAYHSKRECRHCMRRLVENGFSVDGKTYKPMEVSA